MPMTLMDSEFFEKLMARNQKPEEKYRIKDLPKEEGIDFREFLKLLGKALAIAYMLYSLLKIFS
jgi:hypothetical protein